MSLLELAAQAHQVKTAPSQADQLGAFAKLLKDVFQVDHEPTALTTEIDGVTVTYLNSREISIVRKCPDCEHTFPTDGISSLEQLGAELASFHRPHHCPGAIEKFRKLRLAAKPMSPKAKR